MGWYNKIVWSEGLFLRPQMLQQQERYLEYFAHQRANTSTPFFWGFSNYTTDTEFLKLGKIKLNNATGLFRDGTPFSAPNHDELPSPLQISSDLLGQTIYLATPVRNENAEETNLDGELGQSLARYIAFEHEVKDSNSVGMGAQMIQLARLRLELIPERDLGDAWLGLPIAKITQVRSDGSIQVDELLIPPVTSYAASKELTAWLTEVSGLVTARADGIAHELASDSRSAHVAEITDYLILQLLNRYQPLIAHYLTVPDTSPEVLYQTFATLNGELSTFIRTKTRRPPIMLPYDHANPHFCIDPLVRELRYLLNVVLERSAKQITLEKRQHGLHLAILSPQEIEQYATFVLGVNAEMPKDTLQSQFLSQVKIASAEKLLDLVRLHLPGVDLEVLSTAPRQISYHAGYLYLEIKQTGSLWESIAQSGSISMHVAGNFPGLEMELWGIKNQ